jgi:hypothetical protein
VNGIVPGKPESAHVEAAYGGSPRSSAILFAAWEPQIMHGPIDLTPHGQVTAAAPSREAGQARQEKPHQRFDELNVLGRRYQLPLLFHQPQLQHLSLDRDVLGIGLRARRPSRRVAQPTQVTQPGIILIEPPIGQPLDHMIRVGERADALPRQARDARQAVSR